MGYYNDLPSFGDRYLQYYDKEKEVFEIRNKSRGEGILSISESMEIISKFLVAYQTTYIPHGVDKSLYLFPFLFIEPEKDSLILNSNTNERYRVDQIIKNPETDKWEGLLKLDVDTPPKLENGEVLFFDDFSRYIKFEHEMPSTLSNYKSANIDEVMVNPPQITPTITWSLNRVEPGGMNKAFSSKKEYKPRVREVVKDPLVKGYSVTILGQYMDNIVEFSSWSNDHKTSEKLINWFYKFMNMYAPYIRQCGVNQLYFLQRESDSISNRWRQTFFGRTLQYYVRTEELEANYERNLTDINITLNTSNSDINNRIFKERRYIAGQEVTGKLSNQEYRELFYRSGEYLFGDIDIQS